jgi:prepilin-type N-terminal cleavage/methylation domain-containing protein
MIRDNVHADVQTPRAQADQGFSLIELLIVIAIIAVIAGVAAVSLLRSRAAANEASAIASVRVASSSQKAYAIACGYGGYAPSFLVLGTPPPGGGPAFISVEMGASLNPTKSGYQFSLVAGAGSTSGPPDCNGGATITAFVATAVPLSMFSGSRSFAVNADGTVWQVAGSTAPTEPFGPPAAPIQ